MSKEIRLQLTIGHTYDEKGIHYSSRQILELLHQSGFPRTIVAAVGTEKDDHPLEDTSIIKINWDETIHGPVENFCKCLSKFLGKVATEMKQQRVLLEGWAFSGDFMYRIDNRLSLKGFGASGKSLKERRSIHPDDLFNPRWVFQRLKLLSSPSESEAVTEPSMREQSKDSIVIEIGREFMHFLIDYRYVGYNEKFNFTEDQVNIIAETLIIESMRKVWKESMSDTLRKFLTKFGSDMARRVATFVLDNSGVNFTKRFTDKDIFKMAGETAVLMNSLMLAEKLQHTSYVIKAKWTPGSEMSFWMEK